MSHARPIRPALEFLVGRDAQGHWLAIERHGQAGGFFASEDAALRYASADVHHETKRIDRVDTIIEPFGKTCVEIASACRRRAAAH